MTEPETEVCPGCRAVLPRGDGPTHRYIGASPTCWALYSTLNYETPLAPAANNALIVDAYAVQHPGVPSAQSIQSVAVHLVTLYGILEIGEPVEKALWMRQQLVSERDSPKRGRFTWLTPPDFSGSITIAAITSQPTPEERTALAVQYVVNVWQLWSQEYREVVAGWYDKYVLGKAA
jgi:hypothetical protein